MVFVIPDSHREFLPALEVSREVRGCLPEAVVETDLTGRGLARGISRAAEALAGAPHFAFRPDSVRVVLLGEKERESGTVTVKDLGTREQRTFPRAQLKDELRRKD